MFRRFVSDESGVALVLALMAVLVLSVLTGSVLFATAVNHRNAYTSMESDKAFALAEEGIAYAEGRLYTATQPGLANNVPSTPITQDGGSIVYSGSLASTVWTLTATGTYNGVTRKVTVQAPQPAATVTYDTTPWNYFYVKGGPSCLPLGGNGSTNIPMYTQGDMCISGNGAFTGSDLEVKGNLTMLGGNATIGRSGHPISKMNVGGSCSPSSPGPPPTGCAGTRAPFSSTRRASATPSLLSTSP